MSKTARFIIGTVSMSAVLFAAYSFGYYQIDPGLWDAGGRGLAAIIWCLGVAVCAFYAINSEDTP